MKHTFFTLLLGFFITGLSAQTIKTSAVVAGATPAGVAAAIQAARSGVKTVLLEESAQFGTSLNFQAQQSSAASLRTGVYAELLKKMGFSDTAKTMTEFDAAKAVTVMKGITDTVKNLTVLTGAAINKFERDGKGWEFKLKNGRNIKSDTFIDATMGTVYAGTAKESAPAASLAAEGVNSRLIRTSIGSDDGKYAIPASSLILPDKENLILAKNTASVAGSMQVGQAAGAAAAFVGFFKSSTKNLNVRLIQGELLRYDSSLIPLVDVSNRDSAFMAIQRIVSTGLMNKGLKPSATGIAFDPNGTIATEEIRQPMKEFYSRSQIWFADNKAEKITVEQALNLIKFSAARGEELNREVERLWTNKLKFAGKYDLKRPISRKEFAVLIDTYLQPFNVRVDLTGKLLN